MSTKTHIGGITPLDSELGWSQLEEWKKSVFNNVSKKFPKKDFREEVLAGLAKGYPDTAILDYADYISSGRKRDDLVSSKIPYTGTYQEAQPNYFFYPEHQGNTDIQENIQEADLILMSFYESDWHKRIKNTMPK